MNFHRKRALNNANTLDKIKEQGKRISKNIKILSSLFLIFVDFIVCSKSLQLLALELFIASVLFLINTIFFFFIFYCLPLFPSRYCSPEPNCKTKVAREKFGNQEYSSLINFQTFQLPYNKYYSEATIIQKQKNVSRYYVK